MAKNKTKKSKTRLFGGIDIGGTKILAIVADEAGNVLSSAKKKTRKEEGFKSVCQRAADTLAEAADQENLTLGDLAAVGAGVPVPVLADGTTSQAANLPGWKSAPLVRTLESMTGRRCVALNDCNAGTWGEYVYGAGKGARTLIGLFVGTGIGGGIVFHDQLIEGENRMATEIGHIIVHEGGRKCGCGHHGCLEAYASKSGLLRRLAWEVHIEGRSTVLEQSLLENNFRSIKSSELREAYRRGDAVATDALNELALYLGVGVANCVSLLGPDMLVIGGGVFEALGRELLPKVREAARTRVFPEQSLRDTKIVLSQLGDNAVALGSVAWCRHVLDQGKKAQ